MKGSRRFPVAFFGRWSRQDHACICPNRGWYSHTLIIHRDVDDPADERIGSNYGFIVTHINPLSIGRIMGETGAALVLAGRSINDGMGTWIADAIHSRRKSQIGTVLVLGVTFKEDVPDLRNSKVLDDVPDLRNSKVLDVVDRLRWLGHDVVFHDPLANPEEAKRKFGLAVHPGVLEAAMMPCRSPSRIALIGDGRRRLLKISSAMGGCLPISSAFGALNCGGYNTGRSGPHR